MKSFTNAIYDRIRQPESFGELMELAIEGLSNYPSLVRMWRGQADIDWKFDSAAFRRLRLDNHKVTEHDIISYEERLLKQAKHKGYQYLDGRELSDLELLGRLQHHGAATRLVDFTRSALVALWFCISASPNQTGILAGIHAYYIGGYEGELDKREYKDAVKSLSTAEHPITWEPPVVTPRIAAQHSQFVYSDVSNASTGSLKLPSEIESRLFIAITPRMKTICKSILTDVFDIRGMTLFPDLDGFGYAHNPNITRHDMLRW